MRVSIVSVVLLALAGHVACFLRLPQALQAASKLTTSARRGGEEESSRRRGQNVTHTAATWFGDRATASRRRPQAKDFDRRRMLALAALLPAAVSWTPRPPAAVAAEEFPWVQRGGLCDDVLPESVLVKSLPLNYKAIKSMGSALDGINELRGLNILRSDTGYCKDGQVEADLSFVTPAVPGKNGTATTLLEEGEELVREVEEAINEAELSVFRWGKIKRIAEEVRSIFDKEKDALPFALTIRPNTTVESQDRRRQRFSDEMLALDDALTSLQNATAREDIQDTLYWQAQSLLHLGHLGELMVAKFPFAPPKVDNQDDYYNLPRLFGRAQIDLILRESANDSKASNLVGNLTLILDGFNAPISAGNFVDLCQRGFFNKLPFRRDTVGAGKVNEPLEVVVGGTYRAGFVDPITGKQRRVPLEVMRAEQDNNITPFYGQARNTGLFTRAPPLLSFKTPHAVGLFHPEEDGNGANSEFFWLKDDPRCLDSAKYLDGKYALIGYIVGGFDVLPRLSENTFVDYAVISWGLDHFVRSRVSFIDILLQGEDK